MVLIGIAGATCSGKTTLLNNLRKHYSEAIGALSFDDYFIGSDLQDEDEKKILEKTVTYVENLALSNKTS